MSTVQWLVAALAAQGMLLAVILLVLPTRQRLANRLLAMLILAFSARLLAWRTMAALPGLLLLHNMAFLLGPLLWLYARALMDPAFRLRAAHAWHALPALAAVAINLPILPEYRRALEDPLLLRISSVHGILASVSVTVYGILILRELSAYRRGLRGFYARLEGIDLRWLQVLTWLLLAAAVGAVLVNLLRLAGISAHNPVSLVVLPASMLLIYAVVIFGFRQSRILLPPEIRPEPMASVPLDEIGGQDTGMEAALWNGQSAADEAAGRYQRSGLDPVRMQKCWEQLERLVASERLWLDSELDLNALATRLDTTPQVLSQVFNVHAGVRFYDYINRLRVAEAQAMLRDPDHDADTVLDIALAAGFSSKSTFNKYFRHQTGVTPTDWRKLGK